MAQTICWNHAARNLLPKSLIQASYTETVPKTKKYRYDSGGQQNCSVAKYLCNSEKENEEQILASTSSLNNYQEESLLNE